MHEICFIVFVNETGVVPYTVWCCSMKCLLLRRRWCYEWRTCLRGSQKRQTGRGAYLQSTIRKSSSCRVRPCCPITPTSISPKWTRRKICWVKSFYLFPLSNMFILMNYVSCSLLRTCVEVAAFKVIIDSW